MFKELKNKDGDIVLNFQALKTKDVTEFWERINELFIDGYEIQSCDQIPIVRNLTFKKVNYNIPEIEPSDKEIFIKEYGSEAERIEDMTSKEDIIKYAEDNGIEIPKNIVRFLSVKSFVKNAVEFKEQDRE